MNRNHMLKRKMTAGLAVGMAVAVGSVPMAMAANTANTIAEGAGYCDFRYSKYK